MTYDNDINRLLAYYGNGYRSLIMVTKIHLIKLNAGRRDHTPKPRSACLLSVYVVGLPRALITSHGRVSYGRASYRCAS
jgi:hypothetical protein